MEVAISPRLSDLLASGPRRKFLRYLFDLTTTSQWWGSAVGIVRVERELARRARRYLGEDVAFCIYDRSRAAVLVIDDDAIVDDLIEGRARVSLAPPHKISPLAVTKRYLCDACRKLRTAVLHTAYHLFRLLRGRSFTRDQVLQIQASQSAKIRSEPRPTAVPLSELRHSPARLDSDTWMISGGLDWRYKDLRALGALKQTYRFSYCAIVHDLIPIRFPHLVVPGDVELLTEYFAELLRLVDLTMCVSEATRRDWLRYACEAGTGPVPCGVFPLGCDFFPTTANQSNVELLPELRGKQFALYVSSIEPRKNHRMLYEAWDECIRKNQLDPARDRLVFVGGRGPATGDLLHEIETNPLTRDTIVLLHDVSDAQLSILYRTCAFMLFPSLCEGFGLPLAEALGYGKACVSTNVGALKEIGGDLVMRLDPKDTLAWSRAIGRLMSSSSELDSWEARIRNTYRPVTWDDAAKAFFRILTERVLDLGRSNHEARLRSRSSLAGE